VLVFYHSTSLPLRTDPHMVSASMELVRGQGAYPSCKAACTDDLQSFHIHVDDTLDSFLGCVYNPKV